MDSDDSSQGSIPSDISLGGSSDTTGDGTWGDDTSQTSQEGSSWEEATDGESDSEVEINDFQEPTPIFPTPSTPLRSVLEHEISDFEDPRLNPTRNDSEDSTSDLEPRSRVTIIRHIPGESDSEVEFSDFEDPRLDPTRPNPTRSDSGVATSDLEPRTGVTIIRLRPEELDSEVEWSEYENPRLGPNGSNLIRPNPSRETIESGEDNPLDLSTNDDHNSHEASSNNSRTDGIHANHNSDDSDIVFVQSIPNSSVPQVFTVHSDSEGSDIEPIAVAAPVRDSHPEEIEIMEVTARNSNSVRQPLATTSSTIINETNSSPDINSKNASSENTDDSCCIICTELYTNSDPHHVVTLKCGHLFGRKCIETWLQPNRHNQRCPQCNKPAKKRDILKIFSRNLRPLDTCERDQFVKKLKLSEDKAKKLETENKTMRYENRKLHKENEDLKSRMMNCQCHSNFESKRNSTKFPKISPTPKTANFQLAHIKEIDLKATGSRYHCYFKLNDSLVANISRNQINSPLNFSNFGVIKQSLVADAKADYIFMHNKPIKGMVANQQDGSLITVAADKSLKITSIIAKTTIQSTTLDYEPCSVEIIPQTQIIFVGFKNGTIDIFDRRCLNQTMKTVSSDASFSSPVVSMCMIHCKDPDTRALLAVHLDSCCIYTFGADLYEPSFVRLPFTGKSISCDHDVKSDYSLISFRPSMKHQKMTHYVFDWCYDTKVKAIQPCLNRKLEGGSEQVQMARSKIHSNPLDPGSVLVCGPDDRACGAMIWDCKSNFSQPISTYRPLYDFQFIDYSSVNYPIISCLGESFMKLYKMY